MGGNVRGGRWWAALLAVALCAAAARAQTGDGIESGEPGMGGRHVIQGRVYLPSGRKLDRRLRVRLSSVRGGEHSALTDGNGDFVFRNLAAGTYTVTIDGGREFKTATETVDIIVASRQGDAAGQTQTVQVRLEERGAAEIGRAHV